MNQTLQFTTRQAFRDWLAENSRISPGVWLCFGKPGGPETVSAGEALEEALCFGWIDGRMQRIDDKTYRKYFAPRRADSQWSEKNKALAETLKQQGRMTDQGMEKMAEAKRNGRWDAPKPPAVTQAQVAAVAAVLEGVEPAHTHYLSMSPSVQKTYARAYFDAKTDPGRAKRLAWMVERLNQNLKPM